MGSNPILQSYSLVFDCEITQVVDRPRKQSFYNVCDFCISRSSLHLFSYFGQFFPILAPASQSLSYGLLTTYVGLTNSKKKLHINRIDANSSFVPKMGSID